MFKRFELHNHTTQSDASITCEQLVEIMENDGVDAFAITDHNTISGHAIIKRLLAKRQTPPQCVYGMEYTTYYGHILCLNLDRYVPWNMIDKNKPEQLFAACRAAGALTGIAHPYSYGAPFARGCRFEMTVRDFSDVDFIEIFNDLEPLKEVNERGLLWWEDLTLAGEKLAFTCGMDLHGAWDMRMQFATYAEGEQGGDAAREIADAIRARRTWISKGALLDWRYDGAARCYRFRVLDVGKKGFKRESDGAYIMTLRDREGTRRYPIEGERAIPESELCRALPVIPKLYDGDDCIERLVCVSPVIS